MSKKYNVSKKAKKRGIVTGLLVGLILVGGIGAIGSLSNGFKDWNYKNWFVDEEEQLVDKRIGLTKVNLKTDVKGSSLTNVSLISYLNEGSDEKANPIFKDVAFIEVPSEIPETEPTITYLVNNVYKDNGGMKFGASSVLGALTVNLIEDYTFNRIKLIGRNYSALNGQTNEYSCDETSIIANGGEAQVFGTNFADKTLIAPTEEKTFTFESPQSVLKIETLGKRCILFTIELWTE